MTDHYKKDREALSHAAQPQASTTLGEAASHARVCLALAEQYKRDAVLLVRAARRSPAAAGAGKAGSRRAGELACERTRDALVDIRDAIRAMKEQKR